MGGNITAELTGSDTVTYTHGLQLVGGSYGYYLYNAHGDVVGLSDGSGQVTQNYDYDPFGIEKDGTSPDPNPFRYAGEYTDFESGYVYLRARYYAPTLGRFLSEDPHWTVSNMLYGDNPLKINERKDSNGNSTYSYVPDITAITQSGNLYVYGMNNPLLYKDPSGNIALVDDAAILLVLGTGMVITVPAAWLSSPEGQRAINDGATAIYNGAVISGKAVTTAAKAAMDGVVTGAKWVGKKASNAWTWTTGLFLAKNTYGDKTVADVLKTKKGSIKNAPLPPGGPNWSDLLPLSMETIRQLAQKGETGYREI